MISLELNIRPRSAVIRSAAAWFIPGHDPTVWVNEMTSWNVSLADAPIYILPRSISDLTPSGALVVLPQGVPRSTHRAIPYGRRGQRLYLPIDAELRPDASDDELNRLLIWPVQVFHPLSGLCGFKPDDALRIHELIATPTFRAVEWDRAVPGVQFSSALLSVALEQPPTVDDIYKEARDDIGSTDPDLLPPRSDESAARDAMSKAKMPFVQAANWLARHMPGGAGGAIGRWTAKHLAHLTAQLQELRDRELHRLLKLLEDDPDEGLQYAIPLRDIPTRGRAAPTGRLGKRTPWFDLKRFFGGAAPGDAWNVGFDVQQRLRQKYRAAANRELNLGRYRRAAYIFAELLDDVSSAAAALKQGRHFRDAATLYLKRLNSPLLAAQCLEHGGLLIEAASLYEQMGHFVKAGDLFVTLEQPQEVERCYRLAVQRKLDQADVVAAAALLQTRLKAPDEALALLDDAWPLAAQAPACLQAWFALAGRLGYHDQSHRRALALRTQPPPEHRVTASVLVLASVAKDYPDTAVRAVAADITRVIAGQQLQATTELNQRSALVNAVSSLDPDDRLLARDAARFLASLRTKSPRAPIPVKGTATLVAKLSLLNGYRWCAVTSSSDGFYAIGTQGNSTVVTRGDWAGHTQVQTLSFQGEFVLVPSPSENALLGFPVAPPWHPPACQLEANKWFPRPLIVKGPEYLRSDHPSGACLDDRGALWSIHGVRTDDASLRAHDIRTGDVLATHALNLVEDGAAPLDRSVPMVARRGWVYIGWRNQLTIMNPVGEAQSHELPRPVKSLLASAPHTVMRIVATFDEGAAMIQPTGEYQLIADGLFDPVATFTLEGILVVVAGGRGHLYDTRGGRATFRSSFDHAPESPVGVIPATTDRFAILDASGNLHLYSIPAS